MLCGRLASLKDSTNPSYKKKTEETVGVTLTVKAMMMMIKEFFQNERTNNRLRYNKAIHVSKKR